MTYEIVQSAEDCDPSLLLVLDFHVWPFLGAPRGPDRDRAVDLIVRAIRAMSVTETPRLPSSQRSLYGSLRSVYDRAGIEPDAAYSRIVGAMESKGWRPPPEKSPDARQILH